MVHKNKRGLSKLEFSHNARRLRKDLTLLTLRDFGIHSRGKKFKETTGSRQPEGFYDEILQEFSQSIRQLLRNMMLNITAGNRYPTSIKELEIRRMYQNAAITNCDQLLQEILYLEDVIPVKASVFISYIKLIEYEKTLLIGWRKSNSNIEKAIVKNEGKNGN